MSYELDIERIDNILVVRFTRPEIRNPLSVAVLDILHGVVDDLKTDIEITGVIFTGVGDVFASGADLREISGVTPENARDFALRGQSLMTKISLLPQITIAAVNGYCFGGALDLALSCDRRIASPTAQFAHPGTGLGIITGWGGTQRLPRLIGTTNALELFFTANRIDAGRALEVGLVDEVANDPFARAVAVVGSP